MSYYATPILYLNMGGEMLYVLQQRLKTQKIGSDKTIQVMNDVIHALLNPQQLHEIFDKVPLMSLLSLRAILERVVLSSIMRLDDNSMNKLFDLMIMMVKYQLVTASGPREVFLSTLNHLDALRDMAAIDRTLGKHIDFTYQLLLDTYGQMNHKEIWQIRTECLRQIRNHNVRVSILLRLGMQNQDASFNRLVQRYDEQYEERREVLENIKLVDYADDEGSAGSLAFSGDRVTLLGKNVYSSTYGRVQSSSSSRSSQNLSQVVAVSNKSMRKELETMAAQLGKEEAAPVRPFSLHLFGNDNDRSMDCTPDNCGYADRIDDMQDGNFNDDRNNRSVTEYKRNLVKNVNSEFSENDNKVAAPACTKATDLMNLLDAMR
ncbi:protein OSCP1 isoform X1 [Nasonia vitripennis]|uniref:Protein OSCP1 n=1 Tax=Nasonia vitripennis TaxID=7425 RepID=A0A7M7QWI1_NASVI|nr:protein OSCP1 [Nasonia vitripennis]